MTFANGRYPETLLRSVGPGTLLLPPVANAFTNLALIGGMGYGLRIAPASDYGSGFRSVSVQVVFWLAGQGNKEAIAKTHIDTSNKTRIASPGNSTHGWADRIDMLFNGHSPDERSLALAARYGFTREFGADDANHFQHDHHTAVSGVRNYDRIRLVASFLNEHNLGRTTNSVNDGRQFDHDFVWLVQQYGTLTHIYKGKVDGISGPLTEACLSEIWSEMKHSYRLTA